MYELISIKKKKKRKRKTEAQAGNDPSSLCAPKSLPARPGKAITIKDDFILAISVEILAGTEILSGGRLRGERILTPHMHTVSTRVNCAFRWAVL